MTDTRAPRPTDLVGLVTFDDEERPNLAVTRDRLGAPNAPAKPLPAAIEQWLHLGRRTWVHLEGREILGIATARELGSRSAWEIDTLVEGSGAREDVVEHLLRQAGHAARDAGATHVLFRTPLDSPAYRLAPQTGFRLAIHERLWLAPEATEDGGTTSEAAAGTEAEGISVREMGEADEYACYQVHHRALPVMARELLAMNLDEWRTLQDYRWCERSAPGLLAEEGGRATATSRFAASGQLMLVAEPDAVRVSRALVEVHRANGQQPEFALVRDGGAAASALQQLGFEAGAEFGLFALRVSQPVRAESFATAGIAVPG